MTFMIGEDEALHDMLKGMTVSDDKSATRPVGVWFGQPDPEIRQQAFPYVTINMIGVVEDRARTMNAVGVQPWYYEPESLTVDGVTYDDWSMYMPIPVDITYQITTFARQPRHDRQILAQVMANRLPLRFGSLSVKERLTGVDEGTGDEMWDATIRRLDLIDISKRDTVESGKRLFMNVFRVKVSSEIPTPFLPKLYTRVEGINGSIGTYNPSRPLTSTPSFKETFTLSVPAGTP